MRYIFLLYFSVWNLFGLLTVQKGQIENMHYSFKNRNIVISAQLKNVHKKEIKKAVNVNQELMFIYRVDLCRDVSGWFDEVIERSSIKKKIIYKELTDQYIAVTRTEDGRKTVEKRLFASFDEAFKWLTEIKRTFELKKRIMESFKKGGALYIRLRVRLARKHYFFIIPVDVYTPWERVWIKPK